LGAAILTREKQMQTWAALLGAPSVVLVNLSVNSALVSSACALQTNAPLQAVTGAALAFSLFATLIAWRRWRETSVHAAPDSVALAARPVFLASVATGVGAISTLTLVAMAVPQWLLSPC
jgi:hypothetical protein